MDAIDIIALIGICILATMIYKNMRAISDAEEKLSAEEREIVRVLDYLWDYK